MPEFQPTWRRNIAFILYDSNAPLSDVSGYFKNEKSVGHAGRMSFHPFDINHESFQERLSAGPAFGPTGYDGFFEGIRNIGRKMAQKQNEAVMKAMGF